MSSRVLKSWPRNFACASRHGASASEGSSERCRSRRPSGRRGSRAVDRPSRNPRRSSRRPRSGGAAVSGSSDVRRASAGGQQHAGPPPCREAPETSTRRCTRAASPVAVGQNPTRRWTDGTVAFASHLKEPRQHGQSQGGREHHTVRGGPGCRLGPGAPGRRCEAAGVHRDGRDRGPAHATTSRAKAPRAEALNAAARPAVETEPARTPSPLDLSATVSPVSSRRCSATTAATTDPGGQTEALGEVVAELARVDRRRQHGARQHDREHAQPGTECLVEVMSAVQPGRDHDRRDAIAPKPACRARCASRCTASPAATSSSRPAISPVRRVAHGRARRRPAADRRRAGTAVRRRLSSARPRSVSECRCRRPRASMAVSSCVATPMAGRPPGRAQRADDGGPGLPVLPDRRLVEQSRRSGRARGRPRPSAAAAHRRTGGRGWRRRGGQPERRRGGRRRGRPARPRLVPTACRWRRPRRGRVVVDHPVLGCLRRPGHAVGEIARPPPPRSRPALSRARQRRRPAPCRSRSAGEDA